MEKPVKDISGNELTVELPALSVVQIELSADDYTMQGDVNTDGTVDLSDVRLLRDWLLGKAVKGTGSRADLNADQMLDARDLTLLKQILLKK